MAICFVCQTYTATPHTHHVFLQAKGGRDGQTVILCPSHHNLVHRLAENKNFEFSAQNDERQRLLQLAYCAAESAATETKIYKVNLELSAEERVLLERLKIELGSSSLNKTLLFCIRAVANHYHIKVS